MTHDTFVPYPFTALHETEMHERASNFYSQMNQRRSIRMYSDKQVPQRLIEHAIMTASTAPSGAHRQPWRFVAVSNPDIKREIRIAAEHEEKRNYQGRMPPDWRNAIAHLGTNWEKPYLEVAPWLVVLFEQTKPSSDPDDNRKNYYVRESVGIAAGMFIAAIHQMGLATLTHTPSPMHFLGRILERPKHERAFMLFPVGYPAVDATVPLLTRKDLNDVAVFHTESD